MYLTRSEFICHIVWGLAAALDPDETVVWQLYHVAPAVLKLGRWRRNRVVLEFCCVWRACWVVESVCPICPRGGFVVSGGWRTVFVASAFSGSWVLVWRGMGHSFWRFSFFLYFFTNFLFFLKQIQHSYFLFERKQYVHVLQRNGKLNDAVSQKYRPEKEKLNSDKIITVRLKGWCGKVARTVTAACTWKSPNFFLFSNFFLIKLEWNKFKIREKILHTRSKPVDQNRHKMWYQNADFFLGVDRF